VQSLPFFQYCKLWLPDPNVATAQNDVVFLVFSASFDVNDMAALHPSEFEAPYDAISNNDVHYVMNVLRSCRGDANGADATGDDIICCKLELWQALIEAIAVHCPPLAIRNEWIFHLLKK
jgi:hypothetical protein